MDSVLPIRHEVSYDSDFLRPAKTTCPLPPGIPVVFSFPQEEEGEVEEEEEGEAAALHRDVWDSNCNPWPLPQRQVSQPVS